MSYFPNSPDRVDAGNSSTALLTAGATFTGTVVDCTALSISTVTVFSFADQDSATNGLQLQWSQNNSNWDHIQQVLVTANESGVVSDKVRARYYRVVYINGTVNQGVFRLQTLQSSTNTSGTIRDLDTSVDGDDEAQVVRAVLTGKTTVGPYFNDVKTDVVGNLQIGFGPLGASVDAFGRARVGQPTTLFACSFQNTAQPLLWDTVVTGGGTATKTANISSVTLNTGGTTNGDGVYFQTHRYFRYEAGKAQLVLFSGVLGAKKANVRSRYGYYEANDGCYFEMDGTNGASVNIRTNTSGSPSNTSVLQANWNLDKMNGTGSSGITLDFSKQQIFVIDMQWLGTGRVRFGFVCNGIITYCHQVFNNNVIALPYMNTAQLPVRAEIFNTGTAASGTTMTLVCCSVMSEGGEEHPTALQFTASNGVTIKTVTTRAPVLSIAPHTTLNSISNHVAARPISICLYADAQAFYEIVYGGTLTGASFAAVDATNSGTDVDTSASAITGGVVLDSGYVGVGGSGSVSQIVPLTGLLVPTLSAAGVPDNFSVVFTRVTGGTTHVAAAITWEERRA